jgi:ribonucleoside-triphosphate reductase
MNQLQECIHLTRYARWIPDKMRRETWPETVDRYISYFSSKFEEYPSDIIREYILKLKVMPSMRALMTAGEALERDNVSGYNCSYLIVDNIRAFDECMYNLLCGTGVGFSVEQSYVSKLPTIPVLSTDNITKIVVKDSKIGWVQAYRTLIQSLFSGSIPTWDTSRVRPAGTRLKTFGGRASGPQPLEDLFTFTIEAIKKAQKRQLTPIECHDIICKIADVVVSGGVRRSALISLSCLSDVDMQNAKSGPWWESNVQRALANNSAVYNEKPTFEEFSKEWQALVDSKSGERGIINRKSIKQKIRNLGTRNPEHDFGLNPCAEIFLRPSEFCNLSEVIIRETDTLEDLRQKVSVATIIGTFQSTLTNFRHLRDIWKENVESERLLGVSMTGIMDHPILSQCSSISVEWLKELKDLARHTNEIWAKKLGINISAAITCVKPSGTVSELTQTSSGIHPKYAEYYIRTIRGANDDPITKMMKHVGIPSEPDVTKPNHTTVFSFPVKSSRSGVFRRDITAIQQLEHQKMFNENWCEHNVSITVYVREHEWNVVRDWIYENWDHIYAAAFLPYSDHIYAQAPFQEITSQQYTELLEKMPDVDWSILKDFEVEDSTETQYELSCVSGACTY